MLKRRAYPFYRPLWHCKNFTLFSFASTSHSNWVRSPGSKAQVQSLTSYVFHAVPAGGSGLLGTGLGGLSTRVFHFPDEILFLPSRAEGGSSSTVVLYWQSSGERGAALQQLFRLSSRATSHPAPWITSESNTNNVYIHHTHLSTVIWYTAYSKSQTSGLTVKHYNSVSRMKFLRKSKSYIYSISIAVWYIDTHMCILVLFGLETQKPDENVLLEEIVPEVHKYCSHISNSEVVSQLLSWLTPHFLKNVK